MWHPAKPLLENRVEFVHCIVIIMYCLPKTIFENLFCFPKRPILIQTQSPASGLFLFECYRFANGANKTNKNLNYFSGGSRTGRPTRTTTPVYNKTVHPASPI